MSITRSPSRKKERSIDFVIDESDHRQAAVDNRDRLTSTAPYAAALFLDYHLSKEASEIMVKNQGRWAPRKDVPWTRRAAGRYTCGFGFAMGAKDQTTGGSI